MEVTTVITKTSWTTRIIALIVFAALVYLGYKWYKYYQCQKEEGNSCDKTAFTAVNNSLLRDASMAPLTAAEIQTMNELAVKANSGNTLTPQEWIILQGLIGRNVRNSGSNPLVVNKGKVKCGFWGSKTCE